MNKWLARVVLVIIFTLILVVVFRSTLEWLVRFIPWVLSIVLITTGGAMVVLFYKGHGWQSILRLVLSYTNKKQNVARHFNNRFNLEGETVSQKRISLLMTGTGMLIIGIYILYGLVQIYDEQGI